MIIEDFVDNTVSVTRVQDNDKVVIITHFVGANELVYTVITSFTVFL